MAEPDKSGESHAAARHLCIDMQRMFNEETAWNVPWMASVSDQVEELAERFTAETVFTRFVPPRNASQMPGAWKTYYEKWEQMTLDHMPDELVDLVPRLRRFVPPARVFDKRTYSPWIDGRLHQALSRDGVDTLIITGGETDVCVLATVLGAIDLGYRIIIPRDAVCSGADTTHDSTLELLEKRFSVQIEVASTEELLSRIG
jgi:nicotinamidase-related amidase